MQTTLDFSNDCDVFVFFLASCINYSLVMKHLKTLYTGRGTAASTFITNRMYMHAFFIMQTANMHACMHVQMLF